MTEPTQDRRIRVFIADDHAVVRNGLRSFLCAYPEFELVGEAANGETAVRLCSLLKPDVILMDLVMPGVDGITATRLIRAAHPDSQVIALTSYKDREQVQAALQAGAIGYLLKDLSAEDLARAVHQARAGKPSLAPEAAEVLIQAARGAEPQLGSDLTEREVLALMAAGLNNQQIAGRLVIGTATAKTHVSNVLSKLGVATRTEAVSLALQKKLVTLKQ